MATLTPAPFAPQIDYPESDGKPMAETDTHRQAMLDTIATLADFFRARPDVYVAGNLLLYYKQGEPSSVTAPDVFVVFGLDKRPRRTYKLWEEKQAPAVVIEFTSRSTALEDQGNKRVLYSWMGVQEYFLCDPLAEYLDPPLQGYRLVDGEYVRLLPDADGALPSDALGLRLRREGGRLRLLDAATGEQIPWPDENAEMRRAEAAARHAEAAARRHAEERAREAEDRASAAETELARLQAELARLRGDSVDS
jgi:Uma2 family endonuclease